MDEVHVQMEAESSCQKLCRRETNVNAELAADCTGHVDDTSAAAPTAHPPVFLSLIGLVVNVRSARTF